jgi:hypothetical protein
MYDDFLLNDRFDTSMTQSLNSSNDLDSLFDNLTNDISSFNKYVDGVNKRKKENIVEEKELLEEKQRIEKSKLEFEEYVKTRQEEYDKKIGQIDEYLNVQKQNLLKAESEFKESMDNSLNELDISKKELEIQREKFKQEKEQFETYKSLELNRIKHASEILESDKNQFEKYKEVANKKIELENKNLEQKCEKFKQLITQFNSSFKPMIEEEEV